MQTDFLRWTTRLTEAQDAAVFPNITECDVWVLDSHNRVVRLDMIGIGLDVLGRHDEGMDQVVIVCRMMCRLAMGDEE